MNPKEFGWKEDQQVTVQNPTNKNFKFQVHSKEYVVAAGQKAKMPGYIAWVYVYKLASQLAQEAGDFIHWNEEGFRQKYFDKLVVGTEQVVQAVEPEPIVETFEEELEEDDQEEQEQDPPVNTSKPVIKPMRGKKKRKASK